MPSFIIAGREIGIWVGICGISAMGVAGSMVVLQSSLAVSFGYITSLTPAIAWCVAGMMLYGITIGPVARRSGAHTLPEYAEMRFSPTSRFVIAIPQVLGMMGVVALNTVAMARIMQGLAGWPYLLGISVFYGMYLLFITAGGFWGVSITDVWQLVLAIVILPAGVIYLFSHYGGLEFITKGWPDFLTQGFAGKKMAILSVVHPSWFTLMLLFAFIAWGSSYVWMRAANRNERVVKISYVTGGALVLVLTPIIYGWLGIFAGALHPKLFAPIGKIPPDAAVGVLLKTVSPTLSIALLLAILSAPVSTGSLGQIGMVATLLLGTR